jgi:hypothetical protein
MRVSRLAAMVTATGLVAVAAPATASAAGRPFIAKKGTVSIAFNAATLAFFQGHGVKFTNGDTAEAVAAPTFPSLTVAAAEGQPIRAPRTPLNTAKPAGYVYIGNSELAFYGPTGQGGQAEFPVIKLGSHPALEAQLETNATFAGNGREQPLFNLNTKGIKPSLKGATLTLKNVPMTLSTDGAALLSVLGPGLTAGQPLGTLTIKAHR